MSRTILWTTLLALCVWSPATADGLDGLGDGTESIFKAVKYFCDRSVRTERKALEALFTDDVDLIDADGLIRQGRDAVVGHLLEPKPGRRRSIKHLTGPRLLSVYTALAEGVYRQEGDAREMWAVVVLKLTPEGWRISAVRILVPGAPVKFP